MSEKHSVTCLDCGKMYRDFAPEGDPTCQCAEKAVRAMKDEITRPHPAMTAVSDETVLKRNEVLSFDDGLLTIKISGHGAGDGWGSIAFHERQIEIDADGFHVAEIPPSELRALRDFLNRIIPAALSAAPVETWKCAARKQSLPEPADCGWPTCGCDPHADKVIAALEEQGHASPVAQEPVEPFGYLDRTGKFFVRADKSRDELLAAFKDAKIGTPCIKLYTSPPATPAGLGADEIARIIEPEAYRLDTLIDDPNIQDIRKEWAREKANAILTLLSRAGDQK